METAILSFENPVFLAYVIAASIMLLKLTLQPWMTVYRMMKIRGGFRSPAIEMLHVSRVDHGVRCVDDEALVESLIESKMPLTANDIPTP